MNVLVQNGKCMKHFGINFQRNIRFSILSIRWFETNEENKRVDSECDFLVFDPSFGFLTIEV